MNEKKCGLYIRVSTLRQADVEDGSLDTQESRLSAYVNYENTNKDSSWKIADIYREQGRSGKDLNRPEFQRMIKDIDDRKINTVIIWKIDRLTRSLKDFSVVWDLFQKKGVQLISLNEKFDTTSAIGRAMLSIILVFAQLEREQTGERTLATMQYRAEQGLWNGGRAFGYDLDPENKGILIINPEQAEIIRKAFDLCIEKGSAGQVQKALNQLGHRMPVYESRRGKKHGGTMFTKQAVIRMLTNPVYIGKISWQSKIYNGKQEPIIEKRKFSEVNNLLKKNRKTRSNDKLPREHVYILQGVLRCGKCGSMMTPKSGINGSGKSYHYYQCTRNTHLGKQACSARYVPAESIEKFVLKRVKELTINQDEIKKMIARANKKENHQIEKLKGDKKALSKQLQDVKEKLTNIVDSIETGGVKAFRSLNERADSLESEHKGIEEKLQAIDFEVSKIQQNRLSTEIMCQTFSTFRNILDKAQPQKLKELLFRIIEVVEWCENEKDSASGHCKISYFEQPNLNMPIKKPSEQDGEHLFAQCNVWLPDCATQRTKTVKTITELIACHYRYNNKKKILCEGEKPDFMPANKIFTQKQWLSHFNQSKKKNPILEAYTYIGYLESHPNLTYQDVAEKFNISKARVSQIIALVKKLPQEIIDCFLNKEEHLNLNYFTERKLRPLTLLKSDQAKIEGFREMKSELA
ncbi:recombinase family protein [Patescibacteria group bacterium]|nr:recombinase family protein [Patescibacteria group bacterium]MBU4057299.1 recombinase family protein [Patescibacteria group bacterium]